MAFSEEVLKRGIVQLLHESASSESLWRQVRLIPLRWITHGRIEDIPGLGLTNILPASPPHRNEVATDRSLVQLALPKALEETDWDARNVRPDITIETSSLWVAMETKGDHGHFHGTGQPLLYARYAVLSAPGGQAGKRASIVVVPRAFFEAHPANVRTWETWQIEFRRLQGKDVNFNWGIVLAEDIEHHTNRVLRDTGQK